jgi:hypothetical protein
MIDFLQYFCEFLALFSIKLLHSVRDRDIICSDYFSEVYIFMAKIISFCNQKGGVGKTTSAVNIAASLGILGYKVLLIDLDPQGNATSGAGIPKKSLKLTINDVLTAEVPMEDVIIETEFENLDLILIGNGTSITDWNDGGSNNGEATEN